MNDFILVIGLGSMGKRRIRNLQSLGINNIFGHDIRIDRCKEASEKYGIIVHTDFDQLIQIYKFRAFVISLPPAIHHIYMKVALEMDIPSFIEASVLDTDFQSIIRKVNDKGLCFAPSCTLHFHPAIKKISQIIHNRELGKITNVLYHSGQYLPDWHTYEKVSDFYVSNKETGGGREIVPFELTWITMLFGLPTRVVGFFKKTIEIEGAEDIEDTYNLLMDYDHMIFNLSVDVVSRYATRRMVINGSEKQLYWNWEDNCIKIFDPISCKWEEIIYETTSAENGYNKNITEQMYLDEMAAFLNAIYSNEKFPNTLEHDYKVLGLLYAVENSDIKNKIEFIK